MENNPKYPVVEYGGQRSLHQIFLRQMCEQYGMDLPTVAEALAQGALPPNSPKDEFGMDFHRWCNIRLFWDNDGTVSVRGISAGQDTLGINQEHCPDYTRGGK